jgi:hypothetical protein
MKKLEDKNSTSNFGLAFITISSNLASSYFIKKFKQYKKQLQVLNEDIYTEMQVKVRLLHKIIYLLELVLKYTTMLI